MNLIFILAKIFISIILSVVISSLFGLGFVLIFFDKKDNVSFKTLLEKLKKKGYNDPYKDDWY